MTDAPALADLGPVLLVGAGRMGGALLDGWLAGGLPASRVTAVAPGTATHQALAARGVTAAARPEDLAADLAPAVVVLAVKPQMMETVLPAYARFVQPGTVFLSVAAGRTLDALGGLLGAEAAILRGMPNTPAAVGRGMTVLCANARVTADQRRQGQALLAAVGETAWVADEALMDAATGVSGSGPAYVFHMIEALARAGAEAGLPPDLAARLARATVIGAGELARQSEADAETLRRNVTSPGGTTEAALRELMGSADPVDTGGGLTALMTRSVRAAAARSRELAG